MAKKQAKPWMAWIDYKKAFDSVPHSWITTIIEIYALHTTKAHFINISMLNWKTQIMLSRQWYHLHK